MLPGKLGGNAVFRKVVSGFMLGKKRLRLEGGCLPAQRKRIVKIIAIRLFDLWPVVFGERRKLGAGMLQALYQALREVINALTLPRKIFEMLYKSNLLSTGNQIIGLCQGCGNSGEETGAQKQDINNEYHGKMTVCTRKGKKTLTAPKGIHSLLGRVVRKKMFCHVPQFAKNLSCRV